VWHAQAGRHTTIPASRWLPWLTRRPPASLAGFLEREIASSQAAGQLFVVASGNSGVDLDSVPLYPASYKSNNMISVASSGKDDFVSSFSNVGK
jgi:hypothetical protein